MCKIKRGEKWTYPNMQARYPIPTWKSKKTLRNPNCLCPYIRALPANLRRLRLTFSDVRNAEVSGNSRSTRRHRNNRDVASQIAWRNHIQTWRLSHHGRTHLLERKFCELYPIASKIFERKRACRAKRNHELRTHHSQLILGQREDAAGTHYSR